MRQVLNKLFNFLIMCKTHEIKTSEPDLGMLDLEGKVRIDENSTGTHFGSLEGVTTWKSMNSSEKSMGNGDMLEMIAKSNNSTVRIPSADNLTYDPVQNEYIPLARVEKKKNKSLIGTGAFGRSSPRESNGIKSFGQFGSPESHGSLAFRSFNFSNYLKVDTDAEHEAFHNFEHDAIPRLEANPAISDALNQGFSIGENSR
jgi:hypothetical protein